MVEVYFFSAPIRSGKTTRLMNWISTLEKNQVAGIIAPDLHDGRYLSCISTHERKKVTTEESLHEVEIIKVGRYFFCRGVFLWAQKQLWKSFDTDPEWLIVDEIGPLELRGEGLEPAVSQILEANRKRSKTKLIWVVRYSLLEEVIEHYQIKSWEHLILG